MRRVAATALCALAVGCGLPPDPIRLCQTDYECGTNEVCFPLQGCGDPGTGIVVEVQGDRRVGQLAQDFPVSDGGFSATNDFELRPSSIVGEFVRDNVIYTSSVNVRLRGVSELIPGVVRSYQETFTKPERGVYTLPVGAGNYTVTAEPADQSIPPSQAEVNVTLGAKPNVSFSFSPTDKTISLAGRLLKRTEPGPTPETPIEIPVGQPMDLQAFDPATMKPLSQKVAVKTDGTFFLFVSAEAAAGGSFIVSATPRLTGAFVPSKQFTLTLPLGPVIRLVLGDYGDSLPGVKGFITTSAGAPVKDAAVIVEGPVTGGGTFRSGVVSTDADGLFLVNLLPAMASGTLKLTATPPPNSPAGMVQQLVTPTFWDPPDAGVREYYVDVTNKGSEPELAASRTIKCPDKITVIGTVVRPPNEKRTSNAAIGITVVAQAVDKLKELGDQPMPIGQTTTLTDDLGRFSLELDPAVYQIDFLAGEDLPRTSRVVTVRLDSEMTGSKTVDLKETELRKGRKVAGTVRVPNATTGELELVPSAIVRYYRVSAVGGTNVSLLLAESLTDTNGNYSVMLPAK